MKLTVIVPIYNEASTLRELLARVEAVAIPKEVLVVDDGSDLATKQALDEIVNDEVTLFVHERNQGKGAAIRTALAHARGDVVIIQDADFEYFPEDYSLLIRKYSESGARAVFGVRDLRSRHWHMRWGNKILTQMTNVLFGSRLHDMETCYKLIERRLLQSLELNSRRFEIEAEITGKLLRSGVTIEEVPIRYDPREEGKKLTPWDGFPTVARLIRTRYWRPRTVMVEAE